MGKEERRLIAELARPAYSSVLCFRFLQTGITSTSLGYQVFGFRLNHTTKLSVVSNLQMADRGLLSLHNQVSQVLITNLFIRLLVLFLFGNHQWVSAAAAPFHISTRVKIPVSSHHLYQLTCLKDIFCLF